MTTTQPSLDGLRDISLENKLIIKDLLRSQQKELLERVRKEVIGEDEDIETIPPQMSTDYINYVHAQNRLRSEQRKALDDIIDIY